MFESEALKSLGAFPLVQAAVAILVIFAGIYLMRRGERDRKEAQPQTIPQWILMGPVHDAIGAVHDIAEQGRQQTELLKRIDDQLQASKVTLELIRNESRLR